MSTRFALALTLMLTVPGIAIAQVRFTDLNLALGQLDIAVRSLPPVPAQPRLRAATDWLTSRGRTTNPATVSPEYVRSLQRAADLIREDRRTAVLDDVANELEAKVEHCRALEIGMGGSVALTVNTRRGSAAVGNLQVFYLLKIYEHVKDAPATAFPALSSPTEAQLDPGRYWLWARDPATGRSSERALIRVSGQKQFRVDLPVP